MLIMLKVYPQCNFADIGAFEANKGWSMMSDNNAEYSIQSEIVHGGSSALKIWAKETHSWNIRMIQGCDLPLQKNMAYTVTFWMKGEVGSQFGAALQANDNGVYVLREDITTIADTEWRQYTYIFTTDGNYSKGKVKITFKKAGTYYLDDLNVVITPVEVYNTYRIAPNNTNIRYSGVVNSTISETTAELLRFTSDFLNIPAQERKFDSVRARTQSGITISFKTNSPLIKMNFSELENSEIRGRNFAIFKNGNLMQEGIKTLSFDIDNGAKDNAEWTISLPSFSGVKFDGLELVEGYSLAPLAADERPVYVAIGNSITHGVGQEDASHLTYPFLLAKSLDFQLYNMGIGASRVTAQVAQNLDNLNPKLISILWGYNDMTNATPLAQMFTEYENLLNLLIQKHPQASICVVLQTYTTTTAATGNPDNTIDALRNGLINLVDRLSAAHPKLSYFDGWTSTESASNLVDAVHLSREGAANLAAALYLELKDKVGTRLPFLKENEKKVWKVFPNPTKDKIQVVTNNEPNGEELLFFNVVGQLVHAIPLTTKKQVVDITSLKSKGIYFVSLGKQDMKGAVKLVVND
ncbi:hypothetical protein MASR2M117_14620 [Paludibacter sp.]